MTGFLLERDVTYHFMTSEEAVLSFADFINVFQNKTCIKEARKLLEFAEEIVYVPRIYVGKM